jgi:hypothetical protein
MRHAADDTGLLERLADTERLETLERLSLLDTPAERVFDRLTAFTARELGVPVVLVTLVTDDRQFFKSACGLPSPWDTATETPLSYSFCQYVVAQDEALIVVDAPRDPRLRDNRAVTEIGVRAYAGFPLRDSAGQVIGSFCALDIEPRQWVPHELEFLRDMAATTMDIIELRGEAVAAADAAGRLQRVLVPSPPRLRRGRAWSAYRPGERRLLLGGDFFVCSERDDGELWMMIGDVVGHGPEAAGFAAGLRSAWTALELTGGPLDRLARTLNAVAFTLGTAQERFASALFCRVTPERDRAEIVVAGHPPLVLIDGDGARELRVASGPPLGVLEEAEWNAVTAELPADAGLLLYTDGLTEARAHGSRRVGIERVLFETDRLTRAGYEGDELLAGLLDLAGGEHAADDVALLLVRLSDPA